MRAFLVVAFSAVAAAAAAAQAPLVRFDGWRGDARVWRVEADVITGSSRGVELAANTFLVREQPCGDFELSTEVRLTGANNSGVQYRSRALERDPLRVVGYQCDVHAEPSYAAMLYEEGGAGIVATHGQCVRRSDAGVQVVGELARPQSIDWSQWHRLRIVARGDLMWHELDGRVVTAVQDRRSNAPSSGLIALQVHRGAPMTVAYRGLTVRQASDAAIPAAVAALLRRAEQQAAMASGPTPQWLWDERADDGEELFLRREFALTDAPDQARLAVSCDNHCRIYVNGELVASDDSWESITVVDVAEHLVVGANAIAIHAWNDGGPAALVARLSWRERGADRALVSDRDWRCSADDPDRWDTASFDDSAWSPARVVAALGDASAPWSSRHGPEALGTFADPFAAQFAVAEVGLEGAWADRAIMRLLDVPRSLGSWVSLTVDERGRLFASDQRSGLYRIDPATELGEPTTIERVPVDLGGAQGLLWWRDSLYAVVNGDASGLYRLRDTDGDDMLDRAELLQALAGRGEHGPHSVIVDADGEHLLVVCGNHTKLPALAGSRVPHEVAADRLIPRLDDPHRYWEGHSPRGGWVCRCDANGKDWELLCCGFRNPYDIALTPSGAAVVFDADMEWDMGLPWYRPTRLLEVRAGVDYGWRIGSSKWPTDYPEIPPSWRDLGPGSPTGVAMWASDLVCLDWTFGTVFANGEPVLTGAPLPLTDTAYDAKRRCGYLLTGGRGLPSALLRVDCTSTDASAAPALARVELGDRDLVAARLSLENQPVAAWRNRVLAFDVAAPVGRSLAGLLALARQGDASDLQPILAALARIDFATAAAADRVAWLRVHAVALLRLGPPTDDQRQQLADRLLPLLPTGDWRQDQDLVELLAHVDAKGLLARAVPLLAPVVPSEPPAWTAIVVRNQSYGGVIERMMQRMPPIGQIAVADALRTVEHGWTLEQRRALFAFLAEARQQAGGSSYDGYLQRIVDAAWANCTPAEQHQLADAIGKAKAPLPQFRATPPRGPGRDWQLADIDGLLRPGLRDRDRKAGHNLFHAVGCASCHYFAGEGGSGGPDLTSLGNKFSPRDALEAIVAPSSVISDQYSGQVLTKVDGAALFGVVHRVRDGDRDFYEVLPAVANSRLVRVPAAEVRSVKPSPRSPMPADLIDQLSADEVRDLLAFLLSRGRG